MWEDLVGLLAAAMREWLIFGNMDLERYKLALLGA